MNFDTNGFDDWIIAGDFNLIRQPENRNKPGRELSKMNMFNELISDLDLDEIPFSGREYTWSNMQIDPLLIKLDWVFSSDTWGISFPSTTVQPLSRPISDHVPFVINNGTKIPKASCFRFENHWLDREDFITMLIQGWSTPFLPQDLAKAISVRCKTSGNN